jgi:hypothetical protein
MDDRNTRRDTRKEADMRPLVLAPTSDALRVVSALRCPGPPTLFCDGSHREVSDRARAAIYNSGYSFPSGRVRLDIEPEMTEPAAGLDLAVALALLLADPAHAPFRASGLVAWGALGLDGSLHPAELEFPADLPSRPWVGRFWSPGGRIPVPGEDAVLSIVEVSDLTQAWEALVSLCRGSERRLDETA